MVQLKFTQNIPYLPQGTIAAPVATVNFFPQNFNGHISLLTVNFAHQVSISTTKTFGYTVSLGLYSLTGSTLTLVNSLSESYSKTKAGGNTTYYSYFPITAISAASVITPGTWYWGLLHSTASTGGLSLVGAFTQNPGNNFPGGFIGGSMTESTTALPASIETSNLGIAGSAAMFEPYILITG